MKYLPALDLDDAIRLREQTGYPVLAGGTDLYPAIENGVAVPGVIDLSQVLALRAPISRDSEGWTIPALTTWTAILDSELPSHFDALKQAAVEVGGRQIQNAGTVGGNLCNASPAADGVTALLALGADVVLQGCTGARVVPLGDFILGNRRTVLARDEILTSVRVPELPGSSASIFRKLGARRYLVISIVMAAVQIELDPQSRVRTARVAIGACSDRSLRIEPVEAALRGLRTDALSRFAISDDAMTLLKPIDDVRSSAEFRRHAAKALLEETIRDIPRCLNA